MSAPRVARNPHVEGSRKALAWDKGWRGMKAGLPLVGNPYGLRTGQQYMHTAWEDGWLQARESEKRRGVAS